jgi:stearoyl-CoA desaturase (delta-9 desaturase)
MSLVKRFYTDRYLHIRTFSVNLLVSVALCVAAYSVHSPEFYQFHFAPWHLALIPLGIYAGGVSAVFIHNASHGSFPTRPLNWMAGQLAGMHQLWGFMGWKLIHLVHHQYSDDAHFDTHPPKGMTFWQFSRNMFLYSSKKISERYREHWGMSVRTKWLHRNLLFIFMGMAAANLLFWYFLMGPAGFWFCYVPSYVTNHLLFCHINYYAHPKDEAGATAPGNLDHNLYYNLANALWSGIYYHGNHHRRPLLFNPKKMPASPRVREQEKILEAA